MAYQSFEELEVWRRSCRLAVDITPALSVTKQFALRDQMVRAAISVPSNIAEGAERDSRRDFIRFLRIAKGSAAELRTQSYIASRLDVLNQADDERLIREIKETSAMLQGLIRSLSPQQLNTEH